MHKVSELEGAPLDAAAWLALKQDYPPPEGAEWPEYWQPSRKWEHGGPIIEREPWALPRVNSNPGAIHLGKFVASTPGGFDHYGPTPLIAAMRAFVASKFGDEVELP
jgi:hypothetical protein